MITLSKILTSSIWFVDGVLIGTTYPVEIGSESNGNEGVLLIPQSSRTEASLSV